MKRLSREKIESAAARLYARAQSNLQPDAAIVLECCSESESRDEARKALEDMCERFREAAEKGEPLCLYSDLATVLAEFSMRLFVSGNDIADAVWAAVPQETETELMMAAVPQGEELRLTMSLGCKAMRARDGVKAVENADETVKFVLKQMDIAAEKPCAPFIIGVGLDSDRDDAAALSRCALTTMIGKRNDDPELEALEERIKAAVDSTGYGALGLGGDHTALGVSVLGGFAESGKTFAAVSFGCHALRNKTIIL